MEEQDPLVVEELHSTLGYELLQGRGYSDFVLEVFCIIMKIMTAAAIRPI